LLSKQHSELIELLLEWTPNHKLFYEYAYSNFVKKSNDPYIQGLALNLRADVYDRTLGIVYEVQGIQHYKAIDYFGGESGFVVQRRRDVRKKLVLAEAGIDLVEIPYTLKITKDNIRQLIKEAKDVDS